MYINTLTYIYQEPNMAVNPLQQYFRQPKIYIDLPLSGVYSSKGTLTQYEKLPIFGMTGMDEIIMKTPDALLSGESVAKVIASCCPAVIDSNKLCNFDVNKLLCAIKIATYGNDFDIDHVCSECSTEATYTLSVGEFIEYYNNCKSDFKIELDDIVIKLRPLTYQESNKFDYDMFIVQKQLNQVVLADQTTPTDENAILMADLFEKLNTIQSSIVFTAIDEIQTKTTVVTERDFIKEYLDNSDQVVYNKIKEKYIDIAKTYALPAKTVICGNCNHEDTVGVELNYTTFFEQA